MKRAGPVRVDSRNLVNSFIFYGKGGEAAANRPKEQEALSAPSCSGRSTEEDLRGLTPPIFGHINPYGRFDLDMEKRLPLRNLARVP